MKLHYLKVVVSGSNKGIAKCSEVVTVSEFDRKIFTLMGTQSKDSKTSDNECTIAVVSVHEEDILELKVRMKNDYGLEPSDYGSFEI